MEKLLFNLFFIDSAFQKAQNLIFSPQKFTEIIVPRLHLMERPRLFLWLNEPVFLKFLNLNPINKLNLLL
ncbi:hypothetical protein C7S20_07680 [Christiangramia fulva]|uniref:Uncharacterized protein n=1 Tax=Christiangramia fulva TaxID=2126553 RepID=A0A2R3Z4M1_9FLAO|nr:hypothetical protein C7S20_07680 [Christiangramia fulva]